MFYNRIMFSPDLQNVPIQAITVCSTTGDLTPLRFRYEDVEHQIRAVSVDKVLARKPTTFSGIPCIQYTCSSVSEGSEHLFLLKYNIMQHSWVLMRMLS